MEELVAELGAAFLCSELGLPTDPRQDHAPYIASWLKVLKSDKRAIFTAAAKAQETVDWMTKKTANDLEEAGEPPFCQFRHFRSTGEFHPKCRLARESWAGKWSCRAK